MLKLKFYETSPGKSPIRKYIEKADTQVRALLLERIKAFIDEFPDVQTVISKQLRHKLWEICVRDDRSVDRGQKMRQFSRPPCTTF